MKHIAYKIKFHGPTDHRESRVSITHMITKKRKYFNWDYSKGVTSLDQTLNAINIQDPKVAETLEHYIILTKEEIDLD